MTSTKRTEREREREMKKEGRSVTDRLEGTDEKSVISFASDLAINPSDSTSRSLDTSLFIRASSRFASHRCGQ